MKHLIIFVIIILGILLIKCSVVEKFTQVSNTHYKLPDGIIKYSYQIESNGIFATKKINKGDIIEICPALIEKTKHLQYTDKLKDYYFEYDIDNSLIGLGYCSMYNHSDNPNANWYVLNSEKIKIKAARDIDVGDEIFVSYGDDYWSTREDAQKN
jgi:hypothetical protein